MNATPQTQSFTDAAFKQQPLLLHPIQALSQDPVVRTSKFQKQHGHVHDSAAHDGGVHRALLRMFR